MIGYAVVGKDGLLELKGKAAKMDGPVYVLPFKEGHGEGIAVMRPFFYEKLKANVELASRDKIEKKGMPKLSVDNPLKSDVNKGRLSITGEIKETYGFKPKDRIYQNWGGSEWGVPNNGCAVLSKNSRVEGKTIDELLERGLRASNKIDVKQLIEDINKPKKKA